HYLDDRGANPTGVELDPHTVTAATLIARMAGRDIEYQRVDLDEDPLNTTWDTVVLLSVLHHCRRPEAAAAKIARACRRVIIECRLVERGKKPQAGRWQQSAEWQFADVESLVRYLESIFEGFV